MGAEFFRELGDDEVVAVAYPAFQFGGREGGEVADADPVAFGAVGGLRDAVEVDEVVELVGRAFEDDAGDGLAVEGDEEKHFAGDFEDEALAPLFHDGRVGEGEGEGFELGETHESGVKVKMKVKVE